MASHTKRVICSKAYLHEACTVGQDGQKNMVCSHAEPHNKHASSCTHNYCRATHGYARCVNVNSNSGKRSMFRAKVGGWTKYWYNFL